MNKKLTLTIGIPAHNESENISYMLESVLKQRQKLFVIEKIIVVCDGCTDNTPQIVAKIAKRHRQIHLINDKKRLGKAVRLNFIYKFNKSNFLLTLDADIVLERDIEIEEMVKEITKNKNIKLVSGALVPAKAVTFVNQISNSSFLLLKEMGNYNNGNHIHSVQGCASLLRRDFAASLKYPEGTICDQGYLYIKAIEKNNREFLFAKNTRILFRGTTTFKDYKILAARSIFRDKEDLVKNFGSSILELYKVQRIYLLKAICKRIVKDPVFTPLSIIVNVFVRAFPLSKSVTRHGMWNIVTSSKKVVNFG